MRFLYGLAKITAQLGFKVNTGKRMSRQASYSANKYGASSFFSIKAHLSNHFAAIA